MKLNYDTEVTYAKLHGPIFIPGDANYKDTLTNMPEGPDRKLKLYLQDGALLLITGKGSEVLIPLANVTHMVLAKRLASAAPTLTLKK